MSGQLPAVTGRQLMRLLRLDGWQRGGQRTHGVAFRKYDPAAGYTRVTVVPNKRRPLHANTLGQILGPHQTDIGRQGLAALIAKHGLK